MSVTKKNDVKSDLERKITIFASKSVGVRDLKSKIKALLTVASAPEPDHSRYFLNIAGNYQLITNEIVAIVAETTDSGRIGKLAKSLNIPFIHFKKPCTAKWYQYIAQETKADFFMFLNWTEHIVGLDPETRLNSTNISFTYFFI